MSARHACDRRAGFTLLELLISAALTATLLVMVWSLFGIYTKLNDRGVEQATELQLARALMQQFRADLRQVIPTLPSRQPTSLPSTSPTSAAVPQDAEVAKLPDGPALVGTSTRLTFVVRSTREPLPPPRTDSQRESEPPRPVLYDRIDYRWQKMKLESTGRVDSEEADAADPNTPPMQNSDAGNQRDRHDAFGLTRRVAPWNLSRQEARSFSLNQRSSTRASLTGQLADATDPVPPVDAVPEAVRLRFRYFDGRRWRNSWDSRALQRLPAAIEVTFDIENPERQRRRLLDRATAIDDRVEERAALSDIESEPVAESQAVVTDGGVGALSREATSEYRIVIAVDVGAKPSAGSKAPLP